MHFYIMTYKNVSEIPVNYFHNYLFVHKFSKYIILKEIKQISHVFYELYAILLKGS